MRMLSSKATSSMARFRGMVRGGPKGDEKEAGGRRPSSTRTASLLRERSVRLECPGQELVFGRVISKEAEEYSMQLESPSNKIEVVGERVGAKID